MRGPLSLLASALIACAPILHTTASAADTVQVLPADRATAPATRAAAIPRLVESVQRLPLRFEANRGQADARAKFVARGRGVDVYMAEQGAVLALTQAQHRDRFGVPGPRALSGPRDPSPQRALALRYRFAHANPHPKIEALDPLPGHSNYFIGNDPKRWHTDIPQYQRVRYHDVYPGVDVVYYGKDGQLEFDVEAAPGVDLAQVRLRVDGADALALDDNGDLTVHTALGDLVQRKPVVYQMIGGERREIRGDYVLRDLRRDGSAHEVAFRVPDYDRAYAVVLDPTLVFSQLNGGSGNDYGIAVAVDSSGNVYLAGFTNSINFPTSVGAYSTTNHGFADAFIRKISADGTTVLYSTLIGGSSNDYSYGIGVDSAGQAYITGKTSSTNFPVLNALQPTYQGSNSGFVTALNAAGSLLVYSTYLNGGYLNGRSGAIAVDAGGNAYVTGTAGSSFPVTPGAFDTTYTGDGGFVVKFGPSGSEVYGTYLGNSGTNNAIAIDDLGDAYIAGSMHDTTLHGVYPTRIGSLGSSNSAMMIVELNPTGTGLVYATEVGGNQYNAAVGIAVDGGHQVYFAAYSNATNLPPATPPGPTSGAYEAYLGHLDDAGTQLLEFAWYGQVHAVDLLNVDYPVLGVDLDEGRQALYLVGSSDAPGILPALNPVPGQDCGASCSATTGAFLAQYALNSLTLASSTRVTGGAATNTNFIAVTHDPASGNAIATGASSGTPPGTATPPSGGDDALAVAAAFIGNVPVFPPVVDKFLSPPTVLSGQQTTLTFVVKNPNLAFAIEGLFIDDSFPSCLTGLGAGEVSISPLPICAALFNTQMGQHGLVIRQAFNVDFPPGLECRFTVTVEASGSGACDNIAHVTDSVNYRPPARATLNVLSVPDYYWNGLGSTFNMSDPNNWPSNQVPGNGKNVIVPPNTPQPTLNNDLPATQTFNTISTQGSPFAVPPTIFTGNPYNLLAGFDNHAASATVSADIKANAPIVINSDPAGAAFAMSGITDLNGGNTLNLSGAGEIYIGKIIGAGNVFGNGPGTVNLNGSPTNTGRFDACGGTLNVLANMSQTINVCGNGTMRGCSFCGDIGVRDNGDFDPCTGTTPCTSSIGSYTCSGGTTEVHCAADNSSCTSIHTTGAVQLAPACTMEVDVLTPPPVGTVFHNLITSPGSAITGCPGWATSNLSNVCMVTQCTPTEVSVEETCDDRVFNGRFESVACTVACTP